MRVRLLLALLPLCLFVLVATGCHGNGIIWPSLKSSSTQVELGFSYCDTSMPSEIVEVELALSTWGGMLNAVSGGGMDIYFPGPWPCPYYGSGPAILIGYDEDNKTCLGDLTCFFSEGFHPKDRPELEIVNIYVSRYWLNEPTERRNQWTLRQVGEALGLARHSHTSCLPDPLSGLETVMSLPVPGCPAFQQPQAADAMSLACNIYGYTCDYSPGPWPGGVVAASYGDPDHDIDGVSDAYDSDDDNDTFSDADEAYMGTDALDNCPDNPQHDAWPPDFDQSRVVNIIDLNNLLPPPLGSFGTSLGDPDYSARSDLFPDGVINLVDLNKMMPPPLGFWGQTCVSTESQIVDVIKATEQYKDVQVAESEGFLQATPYIPGRGAYFIKPDRWDDTPNLMEPEGLLYQPVAGGWRLMGVFYLMPSWLVPDPPEGFIGSDDVWTVHDGFCIFRSDGDLETSEGVTEGECGAEGGIWWEEFGHLLPAWLFEYNPDGVFEEVNPNVD